MSQSATAGARFRVRERPPETFRPRCCSRLRSRAPRGADVRCVESREPGGGDGRTWKTVAAAVQVPGGVHAVWLRFKGAGDDLARVDWFAFE